MSDLIAIGYPDEETAHAAAKEAERLQKDLVLQSDAIAVITRDKEGKFHVTTNHHLVGGGATYGMFWGLLFGLLFFIPFFGAAMGILMLALLGVVGAGDMTRMNGLKNFAAVCINSVAAVTFAAGGHVQWGLAACMTVGAVAGGYLAARLSQHIDVRWVRALVIVVGFGMGTYALLKA